MVTAAYDLLLTGDFKGALLLSWSSTPMGQWVYLIAALVIVFGTYMKSDNIEVPMIYGIVLAAPLLTIAPAVGLETAKIGFILLSVSLGGLLFFWAIGRQK